MHRIVVLLALLLASMSAAAQSSLTIYNQNFGVVRQTIPLDLRQGVNSAQTTEITAHLEPESVLLRDPLGRVQFQILEQNYRSEPISEGLLLSLYEGKTIEFMSHDRKETFTGRIIRSGYVPHNFGLRRFGNDYWQVQNAAAQAGGQPIVEVDGKLRFGLPGLPLFPALTSDSILKPTLSWNIASERAARLDAELSYITGGMAWQADYNVVAGEKGDTVALIGWVTIDNQSGRDFENARIKLMAGDVSKIDNAIDILTRADMFEVNGQMSMPTKPITEKSFDEYHLYTLENPTTLHDRETKQVEFVRASGVKAKRLYVYDGAWIDPTRYRGWSWEMRRQDREYGTQSNPKVWVMQEFKNSKENGLGMPLPKGKLRFYREDAAANGNGGSLEFTGENLIDHTPKDETVRVYTGDAFDLRGERKRTNFLMNDAQEWLDESFEIRLRNHKSEPVTFRVVEHLYRWSNWQVRMPSQKFEKKDAQTIEFLVTVPPDGEKVVTYTAHYSW